MVSERCDSPTAAMEDEELRVQCYVRMQGMLRELSNELRQINARSAAELAELKRMIAARALHPTTSSNFTLPRIAGCDRAYLVPSSGLATLESYSSIGPLTLKLAAPSDPSESASKEAVVNATDTGIAVKIVEEDKAEGVLDGENATRDIAGDNVAVVVEIAKDITNVAVEAGHTIEITAKGSADVSEEAYNTLGTKRFTSEDRAYLLRRTTKLKREGIGVHVSGRIHCLCKDYLTPAEPAAWLEMAPMVDSLLDELPRLDVKLLPAFIRWGKQSREGTEKETKVESSELIIDLSVGVVIGVLLAILALFYLKYQGKRHQIGNSSSRRAVTIPIRANGADSCTIMSNSTLGPESPVKSEKNGLTVWFNGLRRSNTVSVLEILEYSYKDLQKATYNFTTLIGQGAFGPVYKAQKSTGKVVAMNVLATDSKHGEKEFQTEVMLWGRLHNMNLVNLVGYCAEKGQHMLIYVYTSKGSLASHLYGETTEMLSWDLRIYIAVDVARGLEYLHDGAVPPVIHRDTKSSNVLLDRARVVDFGLSREEMADKHAANICRFKKGVRRKNTPKGLKIKKFIEGPDGTIIHYHSFVGEDAWNDDDYTPQENIKQMIARDRNLKSDEKKLMDKLGVSAEVKEDTNTWHERLSKWKEILEQEKLSEQLDSLKVNCVLEFDMQEDEAHNFFHQLISAVEYYLRHIVAHRDLQPENLPLDSKYNVKTADFDLIKIMREGPFLKMSCGSPNYAAPVGISGKLYAGPERENQMVTQVQIHWSNGMKDEANWERGSCRINFLEDKEKLWRGELIYGE